MTLRSKVQENLRQDLVGSLLELRKGRENMVGDNEILKRLGGLLS